jgi:hypothetical protein
VNDEWFDVRRQARKDTKMKTKILGLAVVAMISGQTMASQVEKWVGSGAVYSPEGQQLSTYQVSVVNTEVAPNVIQSETTVTLPDGTQKSISQKIISNGNGWSVESNLGKGGGSCYGNDVCENYIAGENGLAYATTIISDGPNARRNLTIELRDGKAVRMLRDKLTKIQ